MSRTYVIRFLPEPHEVGMESITSCRKKWRPREVNTFPQGHTAIFPGGLGKYLSVRLCPFLCRWSTLCWSRSVFYPQGLAHDRCTINKSVPSSDPLVVGALSPSPEAAQCTVGKEDDGLRLGRLGFELRLCYQLVL